MVHSISFIMMCAAFCIMVVLFARMRKDVFEISMALPNLRDVDMVKTVKLAMLEAIEDYEKNKPSEFDDLSDDSVKRGINEFVKELTDNADMINEMRRKMKQGESLTKAEENYIEFTNIQLRSDCRILTELQTLQINRMRDRLMSMMNELDKAKK